MHTSCATPATHRQHPPLINPSHHAYAAADVLSYQTWKSNTKWMSSNSVCDWHGITCDNTGRVTEISLEHVRVTHHSVAPLDSRTHSVNTHADVGLACCQAWCAPHRSHRCTSSLARSLSGGSSVGLAWCVARPGAHPSLNVIAPPRLLSSGASVGIACSQGWCSPQASLEGHRVTSRCMLLICSHSGQVGLCVCLVGRMGG
jgi:hypothetical protein